LAIGWPTFGQLSTDCLPTGCHLKGKKLYKVHQSCNKLMGDTSPVETVNFQVVRNFQKLFFTLLFYSTAAGCISFVSPKQRTNVGRSLIARTLKSQCFI